MFCSRSCSKEGSSENPGLDTWSIGAACIARRLQDPLSEFVKLEPKHLGVGMYQHDVAEARLKKHLDDVVAECVSFVGRFPCFLDHWNKMQLFDMFPVSSGVDLNSAPPHILRRVTGLGPAVSAAIVERRSKEGPFKSRRDLKKVKGLGEVAFRLCAGFVRIFDGDNRFGEIRSTRNDVRSSFKTCNRFSRPSSVEPLDSLMIHPESYDLARRILKSEKLSAGDIGSAKAMERFESMRGGGERQKEAAAKFDTDAATLGIILEVSCWFVVAAAAAAVVAVAVAVAAVAISIRALLTGTFSALGLRSPRDAFRGCFSRRRRRRRRDANRHLPAEARPEVARRRDERDFLRRLRRRRDLERWARPLQPHGEEQHARAGQQSRGQGFERRPATPENRTPT